MITHEYILSKYPTESIEVFAIDSEGVDGESVEDLSDCSGGLGRCRFGVD